eukprot:g5343.t1
MFTHPQHILGAYGSLEEELARKGNRRHFIPSRKSVEEKVPTDLHSLQLQKEELNQKLAALEEKLQESRKAKKNRDKRYVKNRSLAIYKKKKTLAHQGFKTCTGVQHGMSSLQMVGALNIGRGGGYSTAMAEDLEYTGDLMLPEEKQELQKNRRAKGFFSTHMSEALRLNYMDKAPYEGYKRKKGKKE